jgi:tRNA pseudouridine55 synthase
VSQYNGLLIVDKPGRMRNVGQAHPIPKSESAAAPNARRELPTSHDVVQQIRRWSRERRIGHTGTLDPMASGVLVLCLGVATRLVEYYQRHDKRYYAEIVLGAATDTYDALGRVTHQSSVPALDESQIEAALNQFRGEIKQLPILR